MGGDPARLPRREDGGPIQLKTRATPAAYGGGAGAAPCAPPPPGGARTGSAAMTMVDPVSLANEPLLAAIAWSYLAINSTRIVTYVPQIVAGRLALHRRRASDLAADLGLLGGFALQRPGLRHAGAARRVLRRDHDDQPAGLLQRHRHRGRAPLAPAPPPASCADGPGRVQHAAPSARLDGHGTPARDGPRGRSGSGAVAAGALGARPRQGHDRAADGPAVDGRPAPARCAPTRPWACPTPARGAALGPDPAPALSG
ncbi:hypothetical protein Alide_2240 [Alicycliphilus denitrificans BC]|nr:hypothetical protein Alide_2240 [Alicycliphilus denitrificans BC]